MEIIVLVKPVPDMDKIKISRGQGKIFETGKQLFNSYDRVGLQVANDITQKCDGKISVISICDTSKTDILREAYACGADACFNIWDDSFSTNDSYLNALILTNAIKKIGEYDLIICGSKSDIGFSGQIGLRIAENLNVDHFSFVKEITITKKTLSINNAIFIKKRLLLPVLITVDNSVAQPQLPNALNIMKAFKKNITQWTLKDLNLQQNEISAANCVITIHSKFLIEE